MTLAAVGTQPKLKPEQLNPRATRYGLLPVRSQPTHSLSFYVWEIPANKVFPFRPFQGEIVKDAYDNVIASIERMPADQIADMRTMAEHFIELPPLANLSEPEAEKVVDTLTNPNTCTKYPFDLKTECVKCWVDDLRDGAARRIQSLGDESLVKVATDCASLLLAGFTAEMERSRQIVDMAIQLVEEKKKSGFTEAEMLSVYHTHADPPKYRVSTSGSDSAELIAAAISNALKPQQQAAPVIDEAAIAAIVERAVAARTADLEEKLRQAAAPLEPAIPAAEEKAPEESFGEKMARLRKEKGLDKG